MKIDLKELINQQIITEETASKIKNYYQKKTKYSLQHLIIILSIIGAVLIGLGIILIIAHNWNNFSLFIKTFLALVPLIISQSIGFYTILKKNKHKNWQEISSILIFFSIAASINLISQIYHISGNYSNFLATWIILSFPLIYIFRSSFTSLLYIILITYFVSISFSWQHRFNYLYYSKFYVLFLAAIIPYYYQLIKQKPLSNFTNFHHWFIAISIFIAIFSFKTEQTNGRFLAIISLLGIYVLSNNFTYFKSLSLFKKSYYIIGMSGLSIILIYLSFSDFWNSDKEFFNKKNLLPIFKIFLLLFTSLIFFSFYLFKQKKLSLNPFNYLSIIFIILYFTTYNNILTAPIIINIVGLFTGLYFIWIGNKNNDLINLNFGMLIISSLIISRFFDINISFITRGILFIILGIIFFIANYILTKKIKNET